ncbi:hypothetical protein GCM10010968_04750 [Agrococcus terreus]|uniref:FHA domain-containing protein n=1 Tax=Agrococcus terreus TaxID=574649 RepID=A0ABQ2KGF9_9MICO|nr:FHA domain-containing protein [Agrococcus terreus]GGN78701.1 hypothetical protein GCM10010968_04750 [Agrococcus terreus]
MSARIEYAPGEAWCVASGRAVVVCERDLPVERAAALHAALGAVADAAGLRALLAAEPAALIGAVDEPGSRALLRRHGVPATADGRPLPDRFGADWADDAIAPGEVVAAGGLAALDGALLPLEGGVVRVAAVRVAPAPGPAAEPAPEPVVEPAHGAFGQTLPPAAAAAVLDERAEPAAAAPAAEPAAAAAEQAPEAPVSGETPEASEPEQLPEAPEPEIAVPEPEPEAAAPEPEQDPEAPEPEQAPEAPAVADAPPTGEHPLPAAPEAPALADAPAEHAGPLGGLIDSVPGFIRPAAEVRPQEPAPAQPEPDRAQLAPRPAPTAPASPALDEGDHDGMTVTAEQARALLGDRAPRSGGIDVASPATGPLVLSTLCPVGHVNAPGSATCGTCGAAIDEGSAAQRRRPEVAVAVLPSGERIPLGRGVVLGRRPRSRRVEDGRVPRLVTVDSPSEDISRSHLELRVDDWNLVAVDLSSTNGTLLLRDGAAPQRLRPESPTILQLGDRLDLGDDVVLRIESAP